MTDNPFESPGGPMELPEQSGVPSNAAMWWAYLIAPGVAPLVSILMLALFLLASQLFDFGLNPASFLILPVMQLTVGMVISYLVAAVIGMPIAFVLRNCNRLNGFTIHGIGTFCAVLCSGLLSLLSLHDDWRQTPIVFGYFLVLMGPPSLLSATTFWLLVRRRVRSPVAR